MTVNTRILPVLNERNISNFWNKVAITANDDKCWNWTASNVRGYGRMGLRIKGKSHSLNATRVSYAINNSVDPIGKCVLHTCDNPSCCNPKHLFLGTSKDNTDDMMRKKRCVNPKGSHHGKSKLNELKVKDIKDKYKTGDYTMTMLSIIYKVNQSVISRIINNKTWNHVS